MSELVGAAPERMRALVATLEPVAAVLDADRRMLVAAFASAERAIALDALRAAEDWARSSARDVRRRAGDLDEWNAVQTERGPRGQEVRRAVDTAAPRRRNLASEFGSGVVPRPEHEFPDARSAERAARRLAAELSVLGPSWAPGEVERLRAVLARDGRDQEFSLALWRALGRSHAIRDEVLTGALSGIVDHAARTAFAEALSRTLAVAGRRLSATDIAAIVRGTSSTTLADLLAAPGGFTTSFLVRVARELLVNQRALGPVGDAPFGDPDPRARVFELLAADPRAAARVVADPASVAWLTSRATIWGPGGREAVERMFDAVLTSAAGGDPVAAHALAVVVRSIANESATVREIVAHPGFVDFAARAVLDAPALFLDAGRAERPRSSRAAAFAVLVADTAGGVDPRSDRASSLVDADTARRFVADAMRSRALGAEVTAAYARLARDARRSLLHAADGPARADAARAYARTIAFLAEAEFEKWSMDGHRSDAEDADTAARWNIAFGVVGLVGTAGNVISGAGGVAAGSVWSGGAGDRARASTAERAEAVRAAIDLDLLDAAARTGSEAAAVRAARPEATPAPAKLRAGLARGDVDARIAVERWARAVIVGRATAGTAAALAASRDATAGLVAIGSVVPGQ